MQNLGSRNISSCWFWGHDEGSLLPQSTATENYSSTCWITTREFYTYPESEFSYKYVAISASVTQYTIHGPRVHCISQWLCPHQRQMAGPFGQFIALQAFNALQKAISGCRCYINVQQWKFNIGAKIEISCVIEFFRK